VSVCEENDDIENPHDKAATEKLRAEERDIRRLAKRAKTN
jgi:transcription elongation GreA/GreB family factor